MWCLLIKISSGVACSEMCIPKIYPNIRDITWNVEENEILHELFREVSRFSRYLFCHFAWNRLPLGQCTLRRDLNGISRTSSWDFKFTFYFMEDSAAGFDLEPECLYLKKSYTRLGIRIPPFRIFSPQPISKKGILPNLQQRNANKKFSLFKKKLLYLFTLWVWVILGKLWWNIYHYKIFFPSLRSLCGRAAFLGDRRDTPSSGLGSRKRSF